MVYPKNGWLGMGIQCAITTFVVAIVAMGCASPQAPMGDDGEDSMVQTIGDVTVSREGEESVVYIDGLVDPIYSVTTSEDQNVVVVDLVAVVKSDDGNEMEDPADAGRQVAAYDGVVDLVTLSTFDDEDGDTPLTRVEIVMAEAGDAEIPHPLRRVGYRDPITKKHYVFLTNNFKLSPKTIADIYKERWQIEIFFRWIKQNLKIKAFNGNSRNAVMTQIYVALIAYLLLCLFKYLSKISVSLQNLLRVIQLNLFRKCSLRELFEPPPNDAANNHDNRQLTFNFA